MEAVGEATGDVTDSSLGRSSVSLSLSLVSIFSRVAPWFIFPLPSQGRKFIVKADYSSIYPPNPPSLLCFPTPLLCPRGV